MPAYMIVRASIVNEDHYRNYRQAVVPLIESFGGRHVRSGTAELLEGKQQPDLRVALSEFPNMDAIHEFWNSPQYGPVKELRRDAAVWRSGQFRFRDEPGWPDFISAATEEIRSNADGGRGLWWGLG